MVEILSTEYCIIDIQHIDNLNLIRNKFISKVYWLLTLQLLITLSICILFMKVDSISVFVLYNINLLYYDLGLIVITMIVLFCYDKVYPINLVLLHLFTLEISYTIGTMCASYKNDSDLVLMSFGSTTVSFIFLSCYAHYSKIDFSFISGFLFNCLISLIVWCIFTVIFGFETSYLYCLFGIFIFSGYILLDTSIIIYKLSVDEYVIAVIMLYLDFINFFLKMLELLSKLKK